MMNANRNLKSQLPESLEPMILMSASAAELNAAELQDATAGNDLVISLTPDEFIDGGAGHDILIGMGGSNVMRGGDGHDTLISVRGDNVLDGGNGIDKAVNWGGNRADYTVVDLGFGIIEIQSCNNNSDFLTNIEQVEFRDGSYSIAELLSGNANAPATGELTTEDAASQTVDALKTPTSSDDVLVVNELAEEVDALDGDDVIVTLGNGNAVSGGTGDDTILSAGGNSFINGGDGKDTVIYTAGVRADYTLESVPGDAISVSSANGQDILLSVETLSFQNQTLDVASLDLPPLATNPVDPPIDPPVEEVPVEEEPVEVIELDEDEPVDVPIDGIVCQTYVGNSLYTSVATLGEFRHELVSPPESGLINLYANGEFDFHAATDFAGTVTFQYNIIAADGTKTAAEHVIVIERSGNHDGPVDEPSVDNGNDHGNNNGKDYGSGDDVEVEVIELDDEEAEDYPAVENHCYITSICDIFEPIFKPAPICTPTYIEPTYCSPVTTSNSCYNNTTYTASCGFNLFGGVTKLFCGIFGGWC